MENGQAGGGEMMQCVKVGKLNLVDLAGSERVHITGATGDPPFCPQRLTGAEPKSASALSSETVNKDGYLLPAPWSASL